MKNGFTFYWKKNKEKGYFTAESMTEVTEEWQKRKADGYKVTEITQCIF